MHSEPGQPVLIEDASGHVLGTGYVNPGTLISARLVCRAIQNMFSTNRSSPHRLNIARSACGKNCSTEPCYYRLAFGDSDGLPGLIVDRYGDVPVVQITTAGMERLKNRNRGGA